MAFIVIINRKDWLLGESSTYCPWERNLGLWRAEPGGKAVFVTAANFKVVAWLWGEEKMCWILERMAPFLFTEKKKVQTTKFRETISLQQPVAIRQAIVKVWELRATAWKEMQLPPFLVDALRIPLSLGEIKLRAERGQSLVHTCVGEVQKRSTSTLQLT